MIESYHLVEAPLSAYYIPNFVSEEQESNLIKEIYKVPKPKWTCLSNRRLQNWGGLPHSKGMIQEKLPQWLEDCCSLVSGTNVFDACMPNHVLINEYKPGQGIMPHRDGPLYYPIVTTISLGCHTLLDFYKPTNDEDSCLSRYEFSFLLEPRSLLVLKNSLYTDYLHGIAETHMDEVKCSYIKNRIAVGNQVLKKNLACSESVKLSRDKTRISLTIRSVPKIFKFRFRT